MAILVDKDTRVIIQGFTGREATFHAEKMLAYGTNVVGGVTPGKGGQNHLGKPVFHDVEAAKMALGADASIIFVPSSFASEAIIESINAGIALIVVITEGIPLHDMVKVKHYSKHKNTVIIGPNCPGIITPNASMLGIIPTSIFERGNVGIISKSGTLTYEAAYQVANAGLGVSTAIGVGGDSVPGSSILDCVKMFMDDPETESILIIGEIGGEQEVEASEFIKATGNKKPVAAFIAGDTAPRGQKMGHAGAVIGSDRETVKVKKELMKSHGVCVADSPSEISLSLMEAIKNRI